MSGVMRSGLALALAAALVVAAQVAGCGIRSKSMPSSAAPVDASYESVASVTPARVSLANAKPMDAYVQLGGKIKSCWFNVSDPLLPNHVYRADVSPDGSKVQITLHEAQRLGRAGAATYAIDFKQQGSATAVTTENRKMPPEIDAKLRYDIERWKRGETNCSKDMPQVAVQPAAQ